MKLTTVGEIIATRELYIEGEKKRILVLIGKPQQFLDSQDYYCPVQITGIGTEQVKYAGGVDAVQAMQLAFKMIGIDLHALNNKYRGELRWEAGTEGDLGFE